MSITFQPMGNLCRAVILGHLDTTEERETLKSALQEQLPTASAGSALELTFYDADTLPAEIIETIAQRLDRAGGLKIVAYHALLAHSLMRLDLPVRQVSNQVKRSPRGRCRALALAGSAQSLDKILHIVAQLPLSEMAIFVAQHVQEDQPNLLDQLLKTRTEYAVVMPQHLIPVQPGTLYVAPPGYHMKVAHGLVYLTADRKIQFARPSIDALFESLASEYGDAVLAVLLCGYGQDGVAGCGALRAVGSSVIVEDGDECEPARVMPDAAREAGFYDYVLRSAAITSVAAATVAGATASPSGTLLELFLEALLKQYGYDFRGYQRDSLERRIRNLMVHFDLGSFPEFQSAVLSDAALFERLCAELSVGVTSFFRHPEQFREIREKILPYLASFPIVKLWSAGCSTGEEAYSLAVLLDELGLLERSHLFATDINHYLLELAKSGLFPAGPLASNRSNYLASGGSRGFDSHVASTGRFLKVEERLHQRVMFHRHSLAEEGIFNEFQLIICRNVMIYFNIELQRQVLQRFLRSLHADGFLVLGPQDGLNLVAEEQGFVPYQPGSFIYRRPGKRSHD
ncbi:MAG: chemotaxis protein CheB [Pseudomonas sp.]|uniref:chemotaxis protein CheB n=1 Tax=Pseudomonas sp. TaxID=306 RepID=UPI002735B1B1|nr:chemotaxis protein CheB [Pseudomonas sp.]MDP3847446.1 chemotaxis protein CheB [Pseudomonas sp.]